MQPFFRSPFPHHQAFMFSCTPSDRVSCASRQRIHPAPRALLAQSVGCQTDLTASTRFVSQDAVASDANVFVVPEFSVVSSPALSAVPLVGRLVAHFRTTVRRCFTSVAFSFRRQHLEQSALSPGCRRALQPTGGVPTERKRLNRRKFSHDDHSRTPLPMLSQQLWSLFSLKALLECTPHISP